MSSYIIKIPVVAYINDLRTTLYNSVEELVRDHPLYGDMPDEDLKQKYRSEIQEDQLEITIDEWGEPRISNRPNFLR